MSWTSVGLIPTTDGWQYTQPFVGDYIRLRHSLGVNQDDLPYGFTGLIAQAFDFEHTVELFEIRKLYPLNQEDILAVINPFPGRSRRLAVKGQQRYQTRISWQVVIDVWQGAVNAPASPDINPQLIDISTRLARIEQLLGAGTNGLSTSEPAGRFFLVN